MVHRLLYSCKIFTLAAAYLQLRNPCICMISPKFLFLITHLVHPVRSLMLPEQPLHHVVITISGNPRKVPGFRVNGKPRVCTGFQ